MWDSRPVGLASCFRTASLATSLPVATLVRAGSVFRFGGVRREMTTDGQGAAV